MPIPKEILEVKRPRNTIVIAYGKNKDRYAVRERIGCKYSIRTGELDRHAMLFL